jgi:hypothetical protein
MDKFGGMQSIADRILHLRSIPEIYIVQRATWLQSTRTSGVIAPRMVTK